MSAIRVWLSAIAVGCLSMAAWGCDDATDVASISGVSKPIHSLSVAPSGVPAYDVTPINAITGLRVSQSGDVVGWTIANGPTEPMVYTPENGVVVLPTSTSQPYGVARDLSERSAGVITVVGEAKLNTSGSAIHAVRWHVAVPQGTVIDVTDLGVLPGHLESFANAVNSAGQIAGTSDPNSYLSIRSFIYSDATGMVDLGLGSIGTNARALDLNASGVVTGYLGLQAFRWSVAGGFQSLGAPAGWADSFGYAINASGQVAGYAGSASGNAEVIVRYTDGTGWQILGGVGQINVGNGINQWGDVVGTGIAGTGGLRRGVIYTDNLGLLAFVDDLLNVPGSWTIMEAYDINDAQQITGWGINNQTGLSSAVLLTPVSSPPANQPPVASYTVTCSAGACVLDASSSTDDQGIVSYNWKASVSSRGDMTGVQITRNWLSTGDNTYQETLTVTDGGGLTNSVTQTITIPPPPTNQPPVANFTVTCSPGKCVLDASSSTDDHGIVSYNWKASAKNRLPMTGAVITREWLAGGGNTYQETLTVTDGDRLRNSLKKKITIPRP
jgi:probable HAF family extracellular repeat protein